MLDSWKATLAAWATEGREHKQAYIRTSVPNGWVAGAWIDCSVGSGSPRYQAYAGSQYAFTPIVNTGNNGVYTGPVPDSGQEKRLAGVGLSANGTSLVNSFILADWLGFYPLIDGEAAGAQALDNTQTLPRYTDGLGVRAFMSVSVGLSSPVTATMTYTNHLGVAGRTTTFGVANASVVGAIPNRAGTSIGAGSASPFIELAADDLGIRSVQSIEFLAPSSGFVALVLAKPLPVSLVAREQAVWTHVNTYSAASPPPKIEPGASLNFLFANAQGSGFSSPILGMLDFVWG